MLQDLTGLETLRRSESRYRLLYERHANGILMVHPETYAIALANEAACAILGYRREELLERTLGDLHGDEWERVEHRYGRELPDAGSAEIECALRTRDGDERRAQISVSRHQVEGEDVLMVSFRDVTDQRRAERALERAEERLRTVVSGCPIVLFAIDRNGVFTLVEGQGLAPLGLAPGEAVGRSVFVLYQDVPAILDKVRRALSGQEVEAEVEVAGLCFEARFSPRRDPDGSVQGIIGVATDVTRRRRAEEALRRSEEQLREAQKMEAVGLLAGGVAHDFNNLLTVILTQSELLLRVLPRDGVGRRNAEEIHAAGARGALLTRQLLTFSRNDVLALRILDLSAVLDELLPGIQDLAGEAITVVRECEAAPLHVRADRGQVEQAVLSLVVNAIESMPRGGTLRVRLARRVLDDQGAREQDLERAGGYAVLEVEDEGCGMDEATRSHVFEPFFTTKGAGRGTGLGLSTLYGIAKRNAGSVTFRSELGQGSVFVVHLPLIEVPERAPRSDARPGPDLPVGTETVLLAEDEPGVRAIARELLELQGYRILEAANGIDALEIEARHPGPIHLLLTDVVMPRMGGRELAERFAARRPGARLLFASGYTDDEALRDSIRSRTLAFLQKPYTLEALAMAVREALDRLPETGEQSPLGRAGPRA
jgi:two-component system, cell cycle sensor histidine kinase and response regulator CckA